MSPRFKLAFLAIVVAQVFLLLGLIGDREYTLRTGTDVLLTTVPVDPRSLLQGDFAILGYEISTIPSNTNIRVGETVYVTLREGEEAWEALRYELRKPSDGDEVFIKGVVNRPGNVDFGIVQHQWPAR